jgi:hypothetical protein
MNENPALVSRICLDAPVELFQARLGKLRENTALQGSGAFAWNYLQQADLLRNRTEDRATYGIVDVAITPENWVKINCQCVGHIQILKSEVRQTISSLHPRS